MTCSPSDRPVLLCLQVARDDCFARSRLLRETTGSCAELLDDPQYLGASKLVQTLLDAQEACLPLGGSHKVR